jgi:hypothetical protein
LRSSDLLSSRSPSLSASWRRNMKEGRRPLSDERFALCGSFRFLTVARSPGKTGQRAFAATE